MKTDYQATISFSHEELQELLFTFTPKAKSSIFQKLNSEIDVFDYEELQELLSELSIINEDSSRFLIRNSIFMKVAPIERRIRFKREDMTDIDFIINKANSIR